MSTKNIDRIYNLAEPLLVQSPQADNDNITYEEPETVLFQKHTLMVADSIIENQLNIPSPKLLRQCLHDKKAYIYQNENKDSLSGAYGNASFCHTQDKHCADHNLVIKEPCFNNLDKVKTIGHEKDINQTISQYIYKLFKNPNADVFLKTGAAFVTQYLGYQEIATKTNNEQIIQECPNTYRLFFEEAPGENLCNRTFLSFDIALEYKLTPHQKKEKFLHENLRITAQLCSALSLIHEAGIIHRDLKLTNIVYDDLDQNTKLIDFGISKDDNEAYTPQYLYVCAYSSALEEYKIVKNITAANEDKVKQDMYNIISSATDVYSFGLMLMGIFFRNVGYEYFYKLFSYQHLDYNNNIQIREIFYKHLQQITLKLNNYVPPVLQYSHEELNFITQLIQICIDPNPTMRPSAAQVGALCELFYTGITDFKSALQQAQELRPKKPIPEKILEIYKKYDIIPDAQSTSSHE